MSEVNWAEVIIGFILGLSPIVVAWLARAISYLRTPEKKKYLGKFYRYHRSTHGDGKIHESYVTIGHSYIRNRQTVKNVAPNSGAGAWSYSGHMSGRMGMVRYFTLADDSSHERDSWYLFDPFHSGLEVTAGLFLALDHRGFPAAGPMVLSRTQLSSETVDSLMDPQTLVFEPFERLMPGGVPPRIQKPEDEH